MRGLYRLNQVIYVLFRRGGRVKQEIIQQQRQRRIAEADASPKVAAFWERFRASKELKKEVPRGRKITFPRPHLAGGGGLPTGSGPGNAPSSARRIAATGGIVGIGYWDEAVCGRDEGLDGEAGPGTHSTARLGAASGAAGGSVRSQLSRSSVAGGCSRART